MRFGEQLESAIFPQWATYYVRYRQIKNHINALFPTPTELEKEAAADRERASKSLLTLTNPERARHIVANTNQQDEPKKVKPSHLAQPVSSPSPASSVDSDEHEGTPLMGSDRSDSCVSISTLPDSTARSEKLSFNINTTSYGGLERDHHSDRSSDDDSPPHGPVVPAGNIVAKGGKTDSGMHVQLNDVSIQHVRKGGSQHIPLLASHSPRTSLPSQQDSSPALPPSASAAVASGLVSSAASAAAATHKPPLGRRVSAASAEGVVVSKRRFHPLAPQTHFEKMDQVIVKIMGELQKIDEFHRLMEGKIETAFEGLKVQVAAAKDSDTIDTHTIQRQLKQKKEARQALRSKMATSRSANSLSTAVEEKEALSGRSSPRASDEDTPRRNGDHAAPHHHHSHTLHVVGHTRFHARASGHDLRKSAHSRGGSSHDYDTDSSHNGSGQSSERTTHSLDSIPLKAAFSQLLRRATMLIHFVDINYVAIAKLLKCFEKRAMASLKAGREGADKNVLAQATRMHKQMLLTLQGRSFYTSRKVDAVIVPELYALYGDLYEGGNVERAKHVLLASLTEQQYSRNDAFWLGIKLGCIGMLLAALILILIRPVEDLSHLREMQLFAPMYRCVGLLVLLLWLWSFLVQLWDHFGIPYVLMFQLNPRTRLTHFQLQMEAANLTIVYLLNSLLFLTHSGVAIHDKFSLAIYPSAMFLFIIVKLFAPWRRISHWPTRLALLTTLGQVLIAPFGSTRFMDAFVADVLTSMVKVVVDVEASVCIISTYFVLDKSGVVMDCSRVAAYVVPILCALPLWWRFLQCLRRYYDTSSRYPHVYNALKYLMTHSVVIMAAYHPVFNDHHQTNWQTYRIIWLVCLIVSTLYSTWWDLVMDWGLFSRHTEWPGLRRELLYGQQNVAYYYFAIVTNCILRWIWVITIVPFSFEESADDTSPTNILTALVSFDQIIIPVLGALELYRRFQWSILRVEYEQVVQGAQLRVDPHLPIYLQQVAKTSAQKSAEQAARDADYGVLSEVIGMALCLIVIAIIAAMS